MALLPPIHNPDVPYLGPIDRGFTPGEMVRIQGLTKPDAKRISINLQCGPNVSPRDDIGLHVSIRIAENYVVLNTLIDGEWGKEQIPKERLAIGPGQHFEVLLLCDDNDYKIAINGNHFAEFKHRLPGGRVSHLTVDGDLEVSLICYEGGTPAAPETATSSSGVSYEGPGKTDGELSLDDFKPTGPNPNRGYGPPPSQGYGPPPSQGYGPPPNQGYGPPQNQGYGPGPGYGPPGGYGPPDQGYGPPGHGGQGPPPPQNKSSGAFENILGQAGTAIAGALSSGALMNILSSASRPSPPQQGPIGGGYPGYQGPGNGPLSSLLGSLTSGMGGQNQGGGSGGLMGGLLSNAFSSLTSGQSRHH